ncbi:hypothetical protein F0L17_14245 [Streptomyces sp. TRM43335]|uniref:Uncharacterized protein n=1 Tax=Streptomyces taklimakanensis TaxID=2569853 RepID=A0A6G2BDB9_9ACTN|nr:hypothetical protein [Streptomyces taklimakanensis]MTE20248.1 hypothetical protein [Streptomyces taklimakanensis]
MTTALIVLLGTAGPAAIAAGTVLDHLTTDPGPTRTPPALDTCTACPRPIPRGTNRCSHHLTLTTPTTETQTMPTKHQTTNPGLSIRTDEAWTRGILRADTIRYNTILDLADAYREDPNGVTAALAALADALINNVTPEERDALVEDIDDTTTGDATTDLTLHHAMRLRDELDTVINRLGRFNPKATQPSPHPNLTEHQRAA